MSASAKPCVFCAIAAGELSAGVVARTAETVAFLDQRPVFPGHVLVVPRAHVADLDAADDRLLSGLVVEARRVGRAVQRAVGSDGTLVLVNNKVSQSVPHLHVHVVPRRRGDGLRGFLWPRHRYATDGERDAVAARIAAALRDGGDGVAPVEN